MYKCTECGAFFTDLKRITETTGEKFNVCPVCKGTPETAVQCQCCDEWFGESELTNGICDNCVQEFKEKRESNPSLCYKFGKKLPKEQLNINPFLYSMFTVEQVEDILMAALLEANEIIPADCSVFLDTCDDEIRDYLKEVK